MNAYCRIETPLGPLWATAEHRVLTSLNFDADDLRVRVIRDGERRDDDPVLVRTRIEIAEYFAGVRREFTLPLGPRGTPFQQQVWAHLCRIPYGSTTTYGTIAVALGRPKSVRAVGAANGRNPVAIVVPCHRVVGADGSLTGYAGGLDRKRALLAFERDGSMPSPSRP